MRDYEEINEPNYDFEYQEYLDNQIECDNLYLFLGELKNYTESEFDKPEFKDEKFPF